MSHKKPAGSIGEVQRNIEAALEHFSHAWGALVRDKDVPPLAQWEEEGFSVPPGSLPYHLRASQEYVRSCFEGMLEFVGDTDGQLCPYDDCAHDLAIESAGWCKCGCCRRPFFARDTDSDFEDYHVQKPKAGESVPEAQLWCRDLGPSWATPEENDEQETPKV